jgi:hypothetical protein
MKAKGFTAAWLVGAALLASWAVSSASSERRIATPAAAHAPQALPEAARAVEAEVARLAGRRLAPSAVIPAGQRDPFTFGSRYTGAPPRVAAASDARRDDIVAGDVAAAPAPPAGPVLSLTGVAERGARGVVAVISYAGDLHYVSRGDVIAGRYRVDVIAADGVDVFDLMLGTNSRLTLHRP